jgi:hypothetical protein
LFQEEPKGRKWKPRWLTSPPAFHPKKSICIKKHWDNILCA